MKGRVQLWSSHYAPEPTGIGPVSRTLATSLSDGGWSVEVIAAQPHYPDPAADGRRRRPLRERRDGIPVTRFPIFASRESAAARLLQESSYTLGLLAALPFLGRPPLTRPDVMVAASPSFLSLLPAMLAARAQRVPTVLWLHDILPDGAATTGVLDPASPVLRASRTLERAAYRAAERIVVLSPAFRHNLVRKGVPDEKIELIYHPATFGVPPEPPQRELGSPPRVIGMGNIGLSQGLAPLVRAFEASSDMSDRGVVLTITGSGVAEREVRAEIRSERTVMPGVVDEGTLMAELGRSDLALVSQSFEGAEFNLPSKIMNFMAQGLPVIAAVNPESEAARLVRESGAGWVVDSSRPELFPQAIAEALDQPAELTKRGTAGHAHALQRFSPDAFAAGFDRVLTEVIGEPRR
jgi:colanic acid biosynthesis glycosyl transferase WcaI